MNPVAPVTATFINQSSHADHRCSAAIFAVRCIFSGVCLQCDAALELGTRVELTLFLGGRAEGVKIEIEGKVARIADEGFAVRFTQIVGAESFEHLRNLVLYNAADDMDNVQRELDEHLGLKPKDGTYD